MSRLFRRVLAAALLASATPALPAEPVPPAPEFWEVTGLTAGDTLNLRETASTGAAVVAELARGTVLRNLGCNAGTQGWCEVELTQGGVRGWASSQYLRAHAAAATPEPAAAAAPAAPLPPDGALDCSLKGKPVPTCPYAVRPQDDGSVQLVVSFPDGFERILSVTGGEITSPDPTDDVSARPEGGATVVEINGVERIEVPGTALPPG